MTKNHSPFKGKSYEEIYGKEKSDELKEKRREKISKNLSFEGKHHTKLAKKKISEGNKGLRKGKTIEEIYGKEKASYMRTILYDKNGETVRKKLKGKTWEEKYGIEKTNKMKEDFSKKFTGCKRVFSEEHKQHLRGAKKGIPYRTLHNKEIEEQSKKLEEQGFRCIPITHVIPDIIAVKGDNIKVFAVEVEHNRKNHVKKYSENIKSYFDDIIWIILKKENLK